MMTIIREINGKKVEIELTETEMFSAFMKYRSMVDKEDVKYYLNNDEFETVKPVEELLEEYPTLLEDCAYKYRKYRDNDESWARDAHEAVEYTLDAYDLLKEE